MNQRNQDKGVKKNILAAVLGALAGGVAGILFAPKSGKETRGDIKKAVEKATAEIKEKAEGVRDLTVEKYQAIVDEVTGEYQELKDLSAEKLGKIRENLYKNYQKAKKGKVRASA
ncbi:YtxH domain-containing protein [Candidatus Shapirobacteria bacterium]|nr:YtxH domain-containing protein [Candidatus Shapirobacteria bacterium]